MKQVSECVPQCVFLRGIFSFTLRSRVKNCEQVEKPSFLIAFDGKFEIHRACACTVNCIVYQFKIFYTFVSCMELSKYSFNDLKDMNRCIDSGLSHYVWDRPTFAHVQL